MKKFYNSSTKSPPAIHNFLQSMVINHSISNHSNTELFLTYSLTAYERKNKYATGTILFASYFSFIPLQKNMFFSIMDINNLEHPHQSFIQILIHNLLNHSLTLVKGLIEYAQQDISLNDLQTTKYRIIELTEFMDAYTSNYLTHGTSETFKKIYCLNLTKQQEREYISKQNAFTYHLTFKIHRIWSRFSHNVQFGTYKNNTTTVWKIAQLLSQFEE